MVMDYLSVSVEESVSSGEDGEELFFLIAGIVPALAGLFEGDHRSALFESFRAAAFRVHAGREAAACAAEALAEATRRTAKLARCRPGPAAVEEGVDALAARRARDEAERREWEDVAEALTAAEQGGDLGQLQDLFPGVRPRHLRGTLDQASGELPEAIEKLMGQLELADAAVSEEVLRAEAVLSAQEYREKMRLRALTRYDVGTDAEKQECGKKVIVRELRSEGLESHVRKQWVSPAKLRFIDGEKVASKGERFVYVKTKNSVPPLPPIPKPNTQPRW
jgi:hypothetical protein